MSYVSQGGRLVSVKRNPTMRQMVREHVKKFGVDPRHLVTLMKLDVGLAERVHSVLAELTSPDFQHTNHNHNRRLRAQYGITARQQRKDDKAYKRAITGRDFQPGKPFDEIELSDEGRACFGGRC